MKIRNFFKTIVILSISLISGCADPVPVRPANPLCNYWHFPKAPLPVRLSFTQDGRMVGIIGLNNFFAPVKYRSGNRIEIDSIAVTRRGPLPEFAEKFFKVLRSANFAVVQGDRLMLFDRERRKIMTMEMWKQ